MVRREATASELEMLAKLRCPVCFCSKHFVGLSTLNQWCKNCGTVYAEIPQANQVIVLIPSVTEL